MAIGSDGSIYFVDAAGTRVRRADPAGTVRTVAGNGVRGHSGDGGPAKSAAVSPLALAVDPSGVLYIAELYRIRKVDLAGTITTIAGTGERGFSGDGGPATAARISIVSSLAADTVGNVYVADRDNHRIRRIDPSGTITTVAGNGERGPFPWPNGIVPPAGIPATGGGGGGH